MLKYFYKISSIKSGKLCRSNFTKFTRIAKDSVTLPIINLKNLEKELDQFKKCPDLKLCTKLISAFGYKQYKDLKTAEEIFYMMKVKNPKLDFYCWGAIIYAYGFHQQHEQAKKCFDEMITCGIKPDDVSLLSLLSAFTNSGKMAEAMKLFEEMPEKYNIYPNAKMCTILLKGSAKREMLENGEKVHIYLSKQKLHDEITDACLIELYSKCRQSGKVVLLYEEIVKKKYKLNIIEWHMVISAFSNQGEKDTVWKLFDNMIKEGIMPNTHIITILFKNLRSIKEAETLLIEVKSKYNMDIDEYHMVSLIGFATTENAFTFGKSIHDYIIKQNVENLFLNNSLITFYGKCGDIEMARKLFINSKVRDVVTFAAIFQAEALFANADKVESLLQQLNEEKIIPNDQIFTSILTCFSHAGWADQAILMFQRMQIDYKILPNVMHYTCLIDTLGRANRLEEAEKVLRSMPERDIVSFKALLGACRTHKDLERAERISKEIFFINDKDPAAYILLSNLYLALGKKEEAANVKAKMASIGVKRVLGVTKIEVNGKIISANASDKELLKDKDVVDKLNYWAEEMNKMGHIPDTSFVTSDVEEIDKPEALCRHSERIAMAYGVVYCNKNDPLKLTKNLRICGDCHTATKFISIIEKREIIVRDANRYHHFINGKCSCNDYF